MSEYSEIEIETAKILHDVGYKWLARNEYGYVIGFQEKPYKKDGYWLSDGKTEFVSGKFTPIFQSIQWTDNEPTFIEKIITHGFLTMQKSGIRAMNNAEWMIKNGMEFSRLSWGYANGKNIVYYETGKHFEEQTEPLASSKELYAEKSATVKNLITKWLDMEHKETGF